MSAAYIQVHFRLSWVGGGGGGGSLSKNKNILNIPILMIDLFNPTQVFAFHSLQFDIEHDHFRKLEDLKVLKRSPDLLNNVKIGQGQLRLII